MGIRDVHLQLPPVHRTERDYRDGESPVLTASHRTKGGAPGERQLDSLSDVHIGPEEQPRSQVLSNLRYRAGEIILAGIAEVRFGWFGAGVDPQPDGDDLDAVRDRSH
jgi:hypothetical protein